MTGIQIFLFCVSILVYLIGGFVCGRLCVEIVRDKNKDMNEVMWFWAGFIFNVIAVFMTLAVRSKND